LKVVICAAVLRLGGSLFNIFVSTHRIQFVVVLSSPDTQ